MQKELLQLKLQKVWTLVDLPKGKRAIGTKWVYRNKKDERGTIVRNKARLVAQGYTQEEGIDYDKVFALVARIEVIRLFLAYASFMGLIVYQMDVKSAFLYGTIEEEVYVCQPHGFEDPQFPNKVYQGEGSTVPVESHHTPSGTPITSQPPLSSPSRIPTRHETEVPQPSSPTYTNVADEAAFISVDVVHGGLLLLSLA
ncbi:putative ribonuclease H-like domain-containing protein [Tanacetum coccineum]